MNNEIGRLSNALMGIPGDGGGNDAVYGNPVDDDVVMKSIVAKVRAYNG